MAVNCIVPDKKQAQSLGITEGQLHNILQQYYNTPELQNKFTEEKFIDSKLNGLPVIGVSDAQMQAWKEVYSTPQEFDSIEDYNEAASIAEAVFGKNAIGHRETPEGKHVLSIAQPRTEDSFLWRGIANKPFIDKDGNLILRASYDNLFKGYGISFATRRSPAYGYGRRTSRNPFIIRVDRDFMDTIYPLNRDGGTKAVGNRVYGDAYDTEGLSMEERLIMASGEEEIVIPKGRYTVEHDTFTGEGMSAAEIAEYYINEYDAWNTADEIPFSMNVGVPSTQDIKEIFDALVKRVGTEQNAYTLLAAIQSRFAYTTTERYEELLDTEHKKIYESLFEEAKAPSEDEYLLEDVRFLARLPFGESLETLKRKRNPILDENGLEELPFNIDLEDGNILENLISNPDSSNYFERVENKIKVKGDRKEALKALQMYLTSRELPSDYMGVTKEGYLYEKTRKYPLQDQIEAYKESEGLFESAEQQEQAMQVLEFLKEKTGLNFEFISEDRAKELLDGKSTDGVNAFVKGDTAYFIKGGNRKFNTDIASEEMLHPFVASIRKENVVAFESLRKDARRAFPILAKQIESTYKSNVQEELVTQALARAFRKDYGENPNHNAIKDLIIKFWNYVKGWFRNSGDIPIFNNIDRLSAQDLSETITLENLAKIINSELLLENADRINRTALSQEEIKFNPEGYEFYSGGAVGSDRAWSDAAKKSLGVETKHFTVEEYDALPQDEKDIIEREYKEVLFYLSRKELDKNSYSGKLVRRDMMQADNADAIFAIVNKLDNGYPTGGTAYAVIRGIRRGIPVYIFDKSEGQWKEYHYPMQTYTPTYTPVLTKKAAIIGTRQLGDDGRAAIEDVIKETLENQRIEQTSPQESTESQQEKEQLNIRKELVSGYQHNVAILNGLNALRNNDVNLTDSEIDYEARQLSYWISDNVTDIERNPELMYDKFGVTKTNDWATEADKKKDIGAVSKMSRKQIISKITLNKFKEVYRTEIFEDNSALDDLSGRDLEKIPVLSDNINALFELSMSTFSQSEGFTIKHNDQLGVDEVQDSDTQNVFLDDDPVDIAQLAEEGTTLEDWMIDKESMDILGTASAKVRSALSQAFEVDAEGREKIDYLGRKVRLSQNDAVKSIIRWTQGSQNINDMIAKLDEKANTHPWLIQILERLEDTDNETDFISQFYSTFQKHFVFFDIVRKNKQQKYYYMDVNNRPALNNAIEEMLVNYQLNESPMFTPTGWNDTNLNWFKRIVGGLKVDSAYNATESEFNARKANFVKVIKAASGLLGYNITEEDVAASLTYDNVKTVIDALSNILDTFNAHQNNDGSYNPFVYSRKKNAGSIRGYLKNFLGVITESVEDTMESAFYEAGKMRQSYQLPTYATKLFGKLRGDERLFTDTLNSEFKNFQWFYNDGQWRNSMLRDLENSSEKQRESLMVFKRSLKFGRDQYMRGLSPERYALSVLTEFGTPRDVEGMPVSFYRLPIQSNKTHPDFVSFYRYTGDFYKNSIVKSLLLTFGQELSRIQTVTMRDRKEGDVDYIENFDGERGRQFCFLDFLNDLEALANDTFTVSAAKEMQNIIDAKINGEAVDEIRLNKLAKQAIESALDIITIRTEQRFEELGITESIKNIDGVINVESTLPAQVQVKNFIENFVWNDILANVNLSQLLVTDLAYYKGSDDFQKRFAQIGAPGVRGNEFATAYKIDGAPNMYAMSDGRVSDGKIRMAFLNDFDFYKANMIENLEIIFDRNIAQTSEGSIARSTYEALKDSVLSSMRKINVTDGQSLICPTSARKFGYIYGKWSREQEQNYERIVRGNYGLSDLVALTNVRKPFIYTQLSQNTAADGAPLDAVKMGVQIKDSEYMIALAGAMLRNADTGIPNFLKVLYDVMEESAFNGMNYNGKGIDIFAFNSTVKTGLSGSSDASTRWANMDYTKGDRAKAEAELKDYLLKQVYVTDGDGNLTREYNQFMVKEVPVEDYATQVENPFHTVDATVIWGSQMRSILESNLEYAGFDGNPVVFSWTDSKGETHNVGRDEFKKEYEKNAARVLDIYIDKIAEEFGLSIQTVDEDGNLKSIDHFLSNTDTRTAIALALQEEIAGNIERYGPDLLYACTIKDGKFTLPPGDPTQSKRIAQLINSIVKNRLNKPKVDGGMAIQVSSFGMSDQLNIRFFAKDGKTLLPTREEWMKSHPNGDYIQFCRENQGGVAYEENYAPAHMGEFFKYFTDESGNVDVEAIEMLDENLLYSIDERTPTEFYYSISVAKIKDFLPKDAGDGFMRPYEITEIDDSDFDNDKQAKWKLSAQIIRNKEKFGVNELINAVPALKNMSSRDAKNTAREFFDGDKFQKSSTASNPTLFRAMKEAYIKAKFSVEYPTEGEKALLNDQWKMSLAVLQSESNASKLLSPGGNADLAKLGYISYLVDTTGQPYDSFTKYTVKELEKMVKQTDSNLMVFINQMEYYQRNNDASSNLGIFAVAATSHNLLEGQGYALNNEEEFTIAGKHFGTNVELDPMRDADGMLISKSLGSNVSGAADAAKVPSHGYLNINGNTINEYLVLLRTGVPMEKAATFVAGVPIKNLVAQLRKSNVAKNTTNIKELLSNRISELMVANNIKADSPIFVEELTWDEIKNALSTETLTPEIELKMLLMFQRIGKLSEGMRAATFATRYNSVASAVGPLETDNLVHKHQLDKYYGSSRLSKVEYTFLDARDNNAEKHFGDTVLNKDGKQVILTPDNFRELEIQGVITVEANVRDITIGDILNDHVMLQKFSMGYDIADQLFNALEMPLSNYRFKQIIDFDNKYSDFLYGNKEALDKFGDFYLSYLLVQSGIINSDPNLKTDGPQYYMRQFPKDFLEKRSTYKGNALIDAIRPKVDDGIISLELSTSGMKVDGKTALQSAWVELYNKNEKLALDLFKYNFWKGGLGFSPKTFINLVPSRLKAKIDGYNEVFTKNAPNVSAVYVLDQFFRNNAKDNNIVRFVSTFKRGETDYNRQTKEITIRGSQYNSFKSSPFIKFKDSSGTIRLYKMTMKDEMGETLTYSETTPLGNNGEFIEISNNNIEKSFVNSRIEDTSDVDDVTVGTTTGYYTEGRTEEQMKKEAEEYAAFFRDPNTGNVLKNLHGEDINADDLIHFAMDFKKEARGKFNYYIETQRQNIKAIFDANGIKYDESKIEEILRKLC